MYNTYIKASRVYTVESGTGAYFRNLQQQWVLIFVGCLYLWGAYKRMVKHESSNRDLVVAARRRLPLNFTWPWLEKRSVAAGQRSLNSLPGPCDSHSSWALCSRPVMIVLSMSWPSTCRLSEFCIAAQP